MSFSNNLFYMRNCMHLNQADMAEYLGIPKANYTRYESGKTQPKASVLKQIADKFDIDTDSLLSDDFQELIVFTSDAKTFGWSRKYKVRRDPVPERTEETTPPYAPDPMATAEEIGRLKGRLEAREEEIKWYRERVLDALDRIETSKGSACKGSGRTLPTPAGAPPGG